MAGHCKALTESRLTRCASTDHLGEAGVVYGRVDLEADYIAPLLSPLGNQLGIVRLVDGTPRPPTTECHKAERKSTRVGECSPDGVRPVSEYKFAPENRDVAQERFKKTGGAPPQGVKVIGRFAFIGAHSGTPQVSPDGRTLLLVAVDAQGMNMLWLRPLDSLSARPLPGTEGADSPFWSADGLSIGFFANGKLKTVEASGGHALTLCDAPSDVGGTWNQQGVILFSPDFISWIYQIPALGGSPKLVLNVDKSRFQGYGWPNFLPDGSHFTYSAYGSEADQGTYFASLDGRENKLVMRSAGNAVFSSGFLFYTQWAGSRTDLMAVAFAPNDRNCLWQTEVGRPGR